MFTIISIQVFGDDDLFCFIPTLWIWDLNKHLYSGFLFNVCYRIRWIINNPLLLGNLFPQNQFTTVQNRTDSDIEFELLLGKELFL